MPEVNPQQVSDNQTAAPVSNSRQFAGKYKSVEELENGYANQMTETQKIIRQRDELGHKVQVLEALVKGGGNDRVMPADRMSARKGTIEMLAEQMNSGQVDPQVLQAALLETTSGQLAPIVGVMSARANVGAELPEYVSQETEVSQYLAANPERDAEYRLMLTDPRTAAAAMKYAWMHMTLDNERRAQNTTTKPQDASGHDQAAARLDAAIPGSAGRSAAMQAAEEADVKSALERGRASGGASQAAWSDYINRTLGDLSVGH